MKPLILDYFSASPRIHDKAFIAPTASVIGDVSIGAESSVWFGAILRGDLEPIILGEGSNLQDGTVVHVARGGFPTVIGNGVTVGHRCVLHACILEDGAFVGMNATILDRASVQSGAMVAAGALVPPGKIVPGGEVWAGVPAKKIRFVSDAEMEMFSQTAVNYRKHAAEYKEALKA